MSNIPSPEAFIEAAARCPAGSLSDAARATLRQYAAAHPAAERLLALDAKARYDAAGPLPLVNPFRPGDLLDAYRRHQQNNWPRHLSVGVGSGTPRPAGHHFNASFYLLVSHDLFRTALLHLALYHESQAVRLSYLRAYRSDAPGGYEYAHPDKPALADALDTLSTVLWSVVRERHEDTR